MIKIAKLHKFNLRWVEFELNRFKKVLDSVGQSDYHNITQYTSYTLTYKMHVDVYCSTL